MSALFSEHPIITSVALFFTFAGLFPRLTARICFSAGALGCFWCAWAAFSIPFSYQTLSGVVAGFVAGYIGMILASVAFVDY